MSLLEASHLRKCYDGHPAVVDVSFSVAAGEIFGLLGPNGAGKSTTMLMVAGLLRPDAGTVLLDGMTPARGKAFRMSLGMVPQELAVYPELSARENLSFFAGLYRLGGGVRRTRVAEVLALTGLEPNADALVGTFSGGMKRRLNLGIALLHRPRLLILDEPTVGVDPQSRSHLLERVRALSGEGRAVIYASHYMEEVQAICDRVAIVDHGRVIACDTLATLLGRVPGELELVVAGAERRIADCLAGVARVEPTGDGAARVVVGSTGQNGSVDLTGPLARVLDALRACDAQLRSVEMRESNLERLFLELTGHRLRD